MHLKMMMVLNSTSPVSILVIKSIMWGFLSARFDNLNGILLVLSYILGICEPTEFRCARGPCIDKSLQCDDHDQCGDESDECRWGFGLVAALMGATCLGSLLTILVFCCCCSKFRSRCSKSNSRGRIIPWFRVSAVVIRSLKWLSFLRPSKCHSLSNNYCLLFAVCKLIL